MENLMKQISEEEYELNAMMENDDYANSDMLDKVLSISMKKSRLIDKLQEKLFEALNYIEDIHILEKVKERDIDDSGVRYALQDLKKVIDERMDRF